MKTTYRDAVVLIPGFFGFGRLGNFYYFADRVAATLRGALERQLGRPTPVMGIATHPIGSFSSRQLSLMGRLAKIDETLGTPHRFHLFGHSTGGIDAELLRAAAPLGGGDWASLDPRRVRERIASIVTIATPHYGTCLAESPAVGCVRDPIHHLDAWRDAAKLVGEFSKLVVDRPLVHEAIVASLQSSSGAGRFVWDMLTNRGLLSDSVPAQVESVRKEHPPVLDAKVTCFVVAAPDSVPPGGRQPDNLFELLHTLTGQCRNAPSVALQKSHEALARSEVPLVKTPEAEKPSMSMSTNDGIVNSASQLLQGRGSELGAIIIADHGDVLGHYDRADPLTEGTPLNEGFFRSGAGFGDDQFFELYGRIARAIGQSAAS